MAKYDMGFCTPNRWYASAVLTTDTINNTETVQVQTLPDYQYLYMSFAASNYGEEVSGEDYVAVFVDNDYYCTVYLDPTDPEYFYTYRNKNIGSFAAGTHTLKLVLVPGQDEEDSDLVDNVYQTTFTVEDTGRGSFFQAYHGGDTFNVNCHATLSLDCGKYIFSGNFIGSVAGKKVNAKMELYNSHNQKVFSVSIKKGKFKYKEVVLSKDTYTVRVTSTDKQKTADTITFEINGDVYYKADSNDNSIGLVSNVTCYSATVLSDPRTLIANGWVGLGDAVSFRQINFAYDGKYTFTLNTTDQIKLSLVQVTTDAKGQKKEKKVTSVTVNGKKKYGKDVSFGGVLLEKGTYFLQAEALKADKGTNADFSVKVSATSVFFVDGDDGTNNWLYDKNRGLNKASLVVTNLSSETENVYLDLEDVSEEDYDNFVGYGDDTDFAKIKLADSAAVSFSLTATDATKFVIYSLTEKKGKYTLKALQTTKLSKSKGATEYTANTKALSLAAGEYYISMESTNAKKGGSAYYNVTLNADACFWPAEENLESCISGAPDTQDELSFGMNGLEEALAATSGSGLAELDAKSTWQNLLA